jgi:hypothetical protein
MMPTGPFASDTPFRVSVVRSLIERVIPDAGTN